VRCSFLLRSRSLVGVRDWAQVEVGDVGEVVGVDGVERESGGDSDGRDQRVVGAGLRLSARGSEASCDSAERSSRGCVEGERVEVVLGGVDVVTELSGIHGGQMTSPIEERRSIEWTRSECGGGGRESNPPDGDRPSQPL
jgi:hypothetical protein